MRAAVAAALTTQKKEKKNMKRTEVLCILNNIELSLCLVDNHMIQWQLTSDNHSIYISIDDTWYTTSYVINKIITDGLETLRKAAIKHTTTTYKKILILNETFLFEDCLLNIDWDF